MPRLRSPVRSRSSALVNAAGAIRVDSLGLGVEMLALGDYWHPDRDERTDLGLLVRRAKDLAEDDAVTELAERFASLAPDLSETVDGSERLVVPVPSMPARAGERDRPHLATHLAAALAAAGAGEYRPGLVAKTNDTPRLRHVDPECRAEVAASAGYRAGESAAGRHVVVVDDVILTGTTVRAVAACLREAGAASVMAVVAARTRQR